jgi:hypothetical protein
LKETRPYSSAVDAQSFRRADCDSEYYVVVANVRDTLLVNKRAARNLINRDNLKLLKNVELRKKESD